MANFEAVPDPSDVYIDEMYQEYQFETNLNIQWTPIRWRNKSCIGNQPRMLLKHQIRYLKPHTRARLDERSYLRLKHYVNFVKTLEDIKDRYISEENRDDGPEDPSGKFQRREDNNLNDRTSYSNSNNKKSSSNDKLRRNDSWEGKKSKDEGKNTFAEKMKFWSDTNRNVPRSDTSESQKAKNLSAETLPGEIWFSRRGCRQDCRRECQHRRQS